MSELSAVFADGRVYERLMGRWSRLAGRTFLDWLALPKGLRCIDVGCGNGAFTEELIAHSAPAAVAGVDPSDGQLAHARSRTEARLAQFQTGDAQALPFADRSFDAALMALVISFVPDPARAVREMARVTRPGGTVATYMWDAAGGGIPVEPIRGNAESGPCGAASSRPGRVAAGRDAGALAAGGTSVDRDAGHSHPGFVFRLRRFLGIERRAGRSGRTGHPPAGARDAGQAQGKTARAIARRPRRAHRL